MKTHTLKTDPVAFELTKIGKKYYEIRFDDRDFQIGDKLILVETVYTGKEMKEGKPLIYTGRKEIMKITYKLKNIYGLESGWCILSCLFYIYNKYEKRD